jgi:hypothetical protein
MFSRVLTYTVIVVLLAAFMFMLFQDVKSTPSQSVSSQTLSATTETLDVLKGVGIVATCFGITALMVKGLVSSRRG